MERPLTGRFSLRTVVTKTIQSGRETWLVDAAATTRIPSKPGPVLQPGTMEEIMQATTWRAADELRLVRRHHVDLLRTASAVCRG